MWVQLKSPSSAENLIFSSLNDQDERIWQNIFDADLCCQIESIKFYIVMDKMYNPYTHSLIGALKHSREIVSIIIPSSKFCKDDYTERLLFLCSEINHKHIISFNLQFLNFTHLVFKYFLFLSFSWISAKHFLYITKCKVRVQFIGLKFDCLI